MCLILFGYRSHPSYRMIIAANRDEFYDRPTASMAFWDDHNQILAGRDLSMMGTWFGITRTGRMAAITNYRQPGIQLKDAPSRGHLISDYLSGNAPPVDYLEQVHSRSDQYNGFNLLVADTRSLYYYSNRGKAPVELPSGVYGLSNHLLNTQWPKVSRGTKHLSDLLGRNKIIPPQDLLGLLQDHTQPPDDQLPDTGVGIDWERTLSPIFITSPAYGTRCSTVLTVDLAGRVEVTEVTWHHGRTPPTSAGQKSYQFTIKKP